jgi:hypothetical protein
LGIINQKRKEQIPPFFDYVPGVALPVKGGCLAAAIAGDKPLTAKAARIKLLA